MSSRVKNIIILGDVNIHVDNMEDQDAQMLLDSLVAFNQTQQVKNPNTQQRSHPGSHNYLDWTYLFNQLIQ